MQLFYWKFNYILKFNYFFQFEIKKHSLTKSVYKNLYNNTPSNAIVNAASDITYRPIIEADDTGR
jgi:hypothetical protein